MRQFVWQTAKVALLLIVDEREQPGEAIVKEDLINWFLQTLQRAT